MKLCLSLYVYTKSTVRNKSINQNEKKNADTSNHYRSDSIPAYLKLQGAGFILNYWVTPRFIQQSAILHHSPSPIGRMIQVMLVRYESSPVGAYDELLIFGSPTD